MNSIEVTRSAKELEQIVKDFEQERARKDLPALSEALMHNKLDIAQAIIDRKADVNEYAKKPAPERGMAPIHFAESADAVRMLAAAGAQIDAPYKEVDRAWGMRGETKLQTLALTGTTQDMPVIEALLKAGADRHKAFGKEYDYSKGSTLAAADRIERESLSLSTRINILQEQSKPQPELQLSFKYKQDTAYTLSAESADFQHMMKEANKLKASGIDILVNEKANPNIVHAKSNLYKDVDVGRVIEPAKAADGNFIKGNGEVVLASFFEKLPVTHEPKDITKSTSPDTAPDAPKQAASAVKDLADKTPSQTDKAAYSGLPVQSNAPLSAEAREAGPVAPTTDEKGKRIVLTKSDYELPETVARNYKIQDGKFKDKATDALRFEDHGKKLSTPVEDRAVIADMIAVAAAKNWGALELKGTANFKQQAWLEASARGIETKGYKASEQDLQLLEQLKRERGITSDKPAIAGVGDKTVTNSVEVITGKELSSPDIAPQATAKAAVSNNTRAATTIRPAAEDVVYDPKHGSRPDVTAGTLIEHGPAKYKFNPKESDNYYVRLLTPQGEKVLWGKDLERAIKEAGVKVGQPISLAREGSIDVVVDANKYDAKGDVVGTVPVDAYRNKWQAQKIELNINRPLSDDEKLRVDAATKVLGKAIEKYPAEDRQRIIEQLADSINKGTAQLPSPKVAMRSVEKSAPDQSRAPEMEQARSR